MSAVLAVVVVVLAINMLVGLVRAATGPTSADRLTSVLLVGSTGVALLAVLSVLTGRSALRDVALVLVVLSALVVVVFVGEGVTAPRRRSAGR